MMLMMEDCCTSWKKEEGCMMMSKKNDYGKTPKGVEGEDSIERSRIVVAEIRMIYLSLL